MDTHKKNFFDSRKNYDDRLEVLKQKEEEYIKLLNERYNESIKKVKDDFEKYSSEHGYLLTKRTKFIEAEYGDNYLKIRIEFEQPTLAKKYFFKLVIIEESRREFLVYFIPDCNDLYFPQPLKSAFRPKPKNQFELERFNKDLENEFLFLDNKIKELTKITLTLSYHNANYTPSEKEKLATYDGIISILDKLING